MRRIELRPMEPEDLDTLYEIENDIDLWSVGYTSVPYSRYLLRDYIAHSTCDIFADRQVRLMAENEQGETVGIVDISNYEPLHNRAELGVVIHKKYRHQGYGKLMVTMALDYGRRIVHLHQIYAVIDPANKWSVEMFQSLGFTPSHTLQDWLYDGKNYAPALFMQLFL